MIEGLQKIDPDYEERMLQFEMDCDQGKGDAWACHSVGEFLAVVKVSYQEWIDTPQPPPTDPNRSTNQSHQSTPPHHPQKTRVTTTRPARSTRRTVPSIRTLLPVSISAGSTVRTSYVFSFIFGFEL